MRRWQAGSFSERLSISVERVSRRRAALIEADEVESVLADVEADRRDRIG
jgi:hypothetical protein